MVMAGEAITVTAILTTARSMVITTLIIPGLITVGDMVTTILTGTDIMTATGMVITTDIMAEDIIQILILNHIRGMVAITGHEAAAPVHRYLGGGGGGPRVRALVERKAGRLVSRFPQGAARRHSSGRPRDPGSEGAR